MNSHLQRLLARVAPSAPGLALGAQPVNPVGSPLAETDQRIGLPEFSDMMVPTEGELAAREPESIAPPPATRNPAAAPGAPLPSPAPDDPAGAAPRPVPFEVSGSAPTVSLPVSPDFEAPEVRRPETAPGAPERPQDSAVATPVWQPPFEIGAEDFERRAPDVGEEAAPAAPTRQAPAEASPALSAPDLAPLPLQAPPEPILAEARPLRPHVELVPPEPAPTAEAAPALARPALEVEPPVPPEAGDDAPDTRREIVIEEVVIDIVPPVQRMAPAAAQGGEQGSGRTMPLSAEGTSIIGALPLSRRQPTVLGMRRR